MVHAYIPGMWGLRQGDHLNLGVEASMSNIAIPQLKGKKEHRISFLLSLALGSIFSSV